VISVPLLLSEVLIRLQDSSSGYCVECRRDLLLMWPLSLKRLREKIVECRASWGSEKYRPSERAARARQMHLHDRALAGIVDELGDD